MSFYPFVLHEISVLVELILGHLRSVNPARRNDIRPPSRVGRLRTHPAWFGPLSRAAGFATGRLSAGPDYTLSRRGLSPWGWRPYSPTRAHLVVEPSPPGTVTFGSLAADRPIPTRCNRTHQGVVAPARLARAGW